MGVGEGGCEGTGEVGDDVGPLEEPVGVEVLAGFVGEAEEGGGGGAKEDGAPRAAGVKADAGEGGGEEAVDGDVDEFIEMGEAQFGGRPADLAAGGGEDDDAEGGRKEGATDLAGNGQEAFYRGFVTEGIHCGFTKLVYEPSYNHSKHRFARSRTAGGADRRAPI